MMFSLSGILTPGALLAARYSVFGHHLSLGAQPILSLVAGLLILIRPKLLNFIVAIYLILVGGIGVFHLSL